MYGFDKQNVNAMVRRLNKKKIKFGETIPNNMQMKRPGSRVDMSQATIDYAKNFG